MIKTLWAHTEILVKKKDFPIHGVLCFLQNRFFEPGSVCQVFELVFTAFQNNKFPLLKMQEEDYDICMAQFVLLKETLFSSLLIMAGNYKFWWNWLGDNFFRVTRNLLGDIKILPESNLDNSFFNFCGNESIAQRVPSLANSSTARFVLL